MSSDAALLLEAAHFAAHKHRKQKRKDPAGTPYINHPIGVSRILSHEGGVTDIEVLQAALLHDTVEDTDTTIEELKEKFGDSVAGIVQEVTDDKSLPKLARKRQQVEHAPHCSPKAKLVKLADKLYNLRDLNSCSPAEKKHFVPHPEDFISLRPANQSCPIGWSAERIQEYFVWAAEVVRGLRGTHSALEDKLQDIFKERGIEL